MKRLTQRYDATPDGESDVWVKQHDYISAARKLCDYEDLEEQGLLVRLPCRVGTKVYAISPYLDCIYNYEHCKVTQKWKCEEDIPCEYEKRLYCVEEIEFHLTLKDAIGKTVFLTREEAENKLEEMKKND